MRTVLLAATFAAVLLAAPAAPAWGAPVLIDFEDLQGLRGPGAGRGEPVTDQYAALGVRFNGPLALNYARAFPTPMPDFPRVGTAAIEPCYAQEFCTRPVELTFDEHQERLRLWVGYSRDLAAPVDVRLVAFDADGNVVARTAAQLGPSPEPVPIDTPLEVIASEAPIASAEVSLGGIDTGLAVDAIEFERGAPELRLSQQDVDFGRIDVGERAAQRLTATNVGTAELSIDSVILDDDTGAFDVADDDCSGQTLPRDASCAFTVVFGPAAEDEFRALLVVASDDPERLRRLALAGTGVGVPPDEPRLGLSEESIDFGAVEVGERFVRAVTATNVGTAELSIDSVTLQGGGAFGVADDDCTRQPLTPEASCELTVVFQPTAEGQRGDVIVVVSDDARSPHTVSLAGTGVVAPSLVPVPDRAALLWAAAGLLGAIALVRAARRRRSSRWVRNHVRVRPRSEVPVELTTEGLDGWPSHAVRIAARADAGIQSLHEVTR